VAGSTIVGLTGFLFFFVLLWGYLDAKREPVVWIVLFAYLVRTVAYGLHRSLMPGLYTERLYPFEPTGWQWASEGIGTVAASFTFGADFYSWLISVVYLVLPRSSMFIASINVFLSSAVVYVVYKIAEHYGGQRAGTWAALIVTLFPVALLQTIILSRETLVTFFLTAGCWKIIQFSEGPGTYRQLTPAIFCLGIASAPHTGILVSVVLALILLGVYTAVRVLARFYTRGPNTAFSKRGLLTASTVGALGLAATAGFQAVWEPLTGAKVSALLSAENPLNPILQVYNSGNRGAAGYPAWLFTTSPTDAVLLLPPRIVYFLFSPFVWMVHSFRHIAGLLNGIAMVFVFYYASAFFIEERRQRTYTLLYIALILIAFIVIFAIGVKNFGQAFRHRAKILPVLVAFGSVAFTTRRKGRSALYP